MVGVMLIETTLRVHGYCTFCGDYPPRFQPIPSAVVIPSQQTVQELDGQESLVFDPSDRWAILRLLDDDYLESMMTEQLYEVTGKRLHEGTALRAGG